MADKLKQVTVKGTGDNQKVVMWERHPDHPDGEAFVSNNGNSVTVAETGRVKTLIAEGRLTTEGTDAPATRSASNEESGTNQGNRSDKDTSKKA